MTLIRYQPSSVLSQFYNQVNQILESGERSVTEWVPAIDVKETDKSYILQADVPGVQAEAIDITLNEGVLTIKGSRDRGEQDETQRYNRLERAYGTFHRQLVLPDVADTESISAKVANGVLEVVVLKQEKEQPRKIKVVS